MEKNSKILILGGGLVGCALYDTLRTDGYNNIQFILSKKQLNLIYQEEVNSYFLDNEPEYVFLAAAKVGGIEANRKYKADFITENILIQTNVIDSSYRFKVKKLLFMGSSCIYPKHCPQPIKEEYLMTGPLEETNDAYAIAKIAGLKMCQSFNEQYGTNFLCVMPCNLYGPNDNYSLENSHVIPALIRKIHEAKTNGNDVVIWGTGKPKREFLYSYDLARACIFLMNKYNYEDIKPFVNIGSGYDVTIKELVSAICEIVGFYDHDQIKFDENMPDGTPRKVLNVDKIKKLGWNSHTSLYDGLGKTYWDFISNPALRK